MQRVMSDPPSCDISNFISPNPIVLPSPLTSFGGSCPERGTIVPELQVGTWTLKLQKSQYSKSPTYESSTCNLSKRRTCVHISQFTCLAYIVMCIDVLQNFLCTLLYDVFISCPGCPEASTKAAVVQLVMLRGASCCTVLLYRPNLLD